MITSDIFLLTVDDQVLWSVLVFSGMGWGCSVASGFAADEDEAEDAALQARGRATKVIYHNARVLDEGAQRWTHTS